MKKYQIKIMEKLSRIIEERANSYAEAENKVFDKYHNQEIILDYNDMEEVCYQKYPSPIIKSNINISLIYDQEDNNLKIVGDNNLVKEYDDCKSYEEFMFNFENFMSDYIDLAKTQKDKEVER